MLTMAIKDYIWWFGILRAWSSPLDSPKDFPPFSRGKLGVEWVSIHESGWLQPRNLCKGICLIAVDLLLECSLPPPCKVGVAYSICAGAAFPQCSFGSSSQPQVLSHVLPLRLARPAVDSRVLDGYLAKRNAVQCWYVGDK